MTLRPSLRLRLRPLPLWSNCNPLYFSKLRVVTLSLSPRSRLLAPCWYRLTLNAGVQRSIHLLPPPACSGRGRATTKPGVVSLETDLSATRAVCEELLSIVETLTRRMQLLEAQRVGPENPSTATGKITNKEKGKPKRHSAPPSPTGPDTDTTVLEEVLIAREVTLHNRFAPLEIEDVPPHHANPETQSTSLLSTTIPTKPRFVNPQVKYIWKSTHKTTPDEVCAHISGLGFSINDFIVERRNSRRGHKKVWYFALLAEASTIRSIGSKWHSLNHSPTQDHSDRLWSQRTLLRGH